MKPRTLATALVLSLGLVGLVEAAEVSNPAAGHAQNPVWSPDGEQVAFEVNNMANTVALYLLDVNGGQPGAARQVTVPGANASFGSGGAYAGSATWAMVPQKMLLFEASNAGGTMRLFYTSPSGGAANELLSAAQIGGDLTAPAMSPDGKELAFVSSATGKGDVYIWDVASNGVAKAFDSAKSENFPAWSSTGSLALGIGNRGSEDLFSWEKGGVPQPLAAGNGDQTRPVWAGNQVVYFTSERGDGQWSIAVASGGNRKVVAKDVRLPSRSAPAITPDGQWVAWTSANPEQGSKVNFTRLDGSSTTSVNTSHVACGEPALTTANGRVLLAYTALPSEGSDWRSLHIVDVTGDL
jgi:Tol biopolymer transport system component